MRSQSFPTTLGTLVRHLLELLDDDVQAVYEASKLDYRPRYTPVVRALLDLGPCSIRDIARRASITHSAASQTVSQMARRGLVRLVPGADARQRIVRMSPKLRRMLPGLEAQWEATTAAAEALNAELPQGLHDALVAAIDALERQPFRERIQRAAKAAGKARSLTATGR